MSDRYYSSQPITDALVTLEGTEAHHLLHVMRAKPGTKLTVFDGQGGEFVGEVTGCRRTTIDISVGERQPIERELPFQLTLAVALPKGDRQRWLIEKAVELGITRLVPLQTERTVSKLEKATKLNRYVIEASKQSGRNRLMQIDPLTVGSDFLRQQSTNLRLLAHPGGKSLDAIHRHDDLTIAVGPEGGFTDSEVSLGTAAGWQIVGLGPRILRIETAAVAIASTFALQ